MVDGTQNYWGLGLFLLSGILGNRGHDVPFSQVPELSPQLSYRLLTATAYKV
jgi:hypothetical protein